MKITVFQHHPADGPGTIRDWAKSRSIELDFRNPAEESAHEISDALIVLGGPMGTYEEDKYPWLRTEKDTIRKAISQDKKALGICLGAQLLADCLGSRVYPHTHKEIGWFPVEKLSEPGAHSFLDGFAPVTYAFHWHGDTFDLPKDAIRLFRSSVCLNQGFLSGRNVLGIQFHPEADKDWITTITSALKTQLDAQPFVQSVEAMLAEVEKARETREPFFRMLDGFFG